LSGDNFKIQDSVSRLNRETWQHCGW